MTRNFATRPETTAPTPGFLTTSAPLRRVVSQTPPVGWSRWAAPTATTLFIATSQKEKEKKRKTTCILCGYFLFQRHACAASCVEICWKRDNQIPGKHLWAPEEPPRKLQVCISDVQKQTSGNGKAKNKLFLPIPNANLVPKESGVFIRLSSTLSAIPSSSRCCSPYPRGWFPEPSSGLDPAFLRPICFLFLFFHVKKNMKII